MENPIKMDDLGVKSPYFWFNTQLDPSHNKIPLVCQRWNVTCHPQASIYARKSNHTTKGRSSYGLVVFFFFGGGDGMGRSPTTKDVTHLQRGSVFFFNTFTMFTRCFSIRLLNFNVVFLFWALAVGDRFL